MIDGTPFTDYVAKHDAFIPRTMSCRQIGKKSNHALNYMMGAHRFSMESGLSLTEAERARALYLRAYDWLHEWWDSINEQLHKDRTIINPVGQPRRFLGTLDEKLLKEAVAHVPQSTSVWMVNNAMSKIYDVETHRAEILSQVHDSLLFQHPYDELDQIESFCIYAKDALEPKLTVTNDDITRSFYVQTDIKIGFDAAKMYPTTISTIKEDIAKLTKLRNDRDRSAKVAV